MKCSADSSSPHLLHNGELTTPISQRCLLSPQCSVRISESLLMFPLLNSLKYLEFFSPKGILIANFLSTRKTGATPSTGISNWGVSFTITFQSLECPTPKVTNKSDWANLRIEALALASIKTC